MMDISPTDVEPKLAGDLTDFFEGVDADNSLDISVSVRQSGQVVVFYNRPLKAPIALFEFNLDTRAFYFVLDDGQKHQIGLPLTQNVAPHMQNAHQILTVLIDAETGEATLGQYLPLILRKD